jgi:hypothetical protein
MPPPPGDFPPPPPTEPDAKRARTDFVLQPEEEFLEAHQGPSKVHTPSLRIPCVLPASEVGAGTFMIAVL